MGELDGVAAAVTGAGRGLGRGVAHGLARRGASVAVLDVDEASAWNVVREIRDRGGAGFGCSVDVSSESSVEQAVATCLEQLQGLDLLVNNAGVLSVGSVVDMTLAEWTRVLNVNATGVFLMSRAVVRSMLTRNVTGSIVSIASISGKLGDPQLAHYSASKFAVVGFTQALARELGRRGITVNAICPGTVRTPMIDDLAQGWDMSVEDMISLQAIHRAQEPDEIAHAVAFLHRNRAVTGQAINVDGGTVFH